jgi:hypothetical protein
MRERLLAALRHRANQNGLATVREAQLLVDLSSNHDDVSIALEALSRAHLVEVLSPLPYLVVKLPKWPSRSSAKGVETAEFTPKGSTWPMDARVSSSQAAAAAASSKQEVGGAGEGERLLDEVVDLLGPEADRDEFRSLLGRFSYGVVRQALRRVGATPPAQIRKSKAALFRYLLNKLS